MSNRQMRYHFSDCVLDIDSHTLTRDGQVQNIEPMVFDLLHLLARNSGSLVTRDQMIDVVWQGRIVSESAISARISAMRRAVGDNGKVQSIVRTVPRRGLQFVAKLEQAGMEETSAPPAAHPTVKFATSFDGVKLAYAVSGSGPAIVRIQHFPTHLELEWQDTIDRKLFDALGRSHTLVRYDQRGSGLSDISVEALGCAQDVEDIKAVADAAGLDRFALLGTSSDAMRAVEFAVKYPERVSHLILLGGYVDGRVARDKAGPTNTPETIEAMLREGWNIPDSPFIKAYLSLYFPTASSELLQTLVKMVQASSNVENILRVREIFNNQSIAGSLENVCAPTLVMHSRQDAVHPLAEAQKLARGIAGAEFLVLESPNHYPLPEEASWQVHVDAMLEFLDREN